MLHSYEPFNVPDYNPERYHQSYQALERIANAPEQLPHIDIPQKLSAFIGNYALHVTNVAFGNGRYVENTASSARIPDFVDASAVDMSVFRGIELGNVADSDILRVGAGNAGVIVEVAKHASLSVDADITQSVHVAAGKVPIATSPHMLKHWSLVDGGSIPRVVHPFHDMARMPEDLQAHAQTMRALTRLIVGNVPSSI